MMLQLGEVQEVEVLRETEIGYMIGNEEEEIFLHKNEVAGEIAEGEYIDVFLYRDHQDRLTATMKTPLITTKDFGWVKVVQVSPGLGVFVDIGVSKDMLIPGDEFSGFYGVWPKEDDELYCRLKVTGRDRLIALPAEESDWENIAVPATESMFNKNVNAYVYRVIRVGAFVITDEHFLGFIHESERREEPRVGQRVTGRIIAVKDDGTVNISLLPRKQEGLDMDAQVIYEYMENRGGAMPFGDQSAPEDIKERFSMSKGAFKRALGRLMKDGKVYQEEGWTYFKRD